jgi:2-dehydropantoate 2-reductase
MSDFSIAGAGAIGQSLAALLHKAGVAVELLGREGDPAGRDVEVLVPSGETIGWTCPVRTSGSGGHAVSRLLVATKAAAVADVLAAWRGERTYFFQNGVGFIPEGVRGYSIVNTGLAASLEGDTVRIASLKPMWIGSEELPEPTDDLALLAQAGIQLSWCEDIERRRWEKCAINALINPLTVLAGETNGATFANDETAHRALAMLNETARLFEAMGVAVSLIDLTTLFHEVLDATSENTSSMLQDFNRGHAASELPFINGALLAEAIRHGVAMPETTRVTNDVAARFETLA